MSRAYWSARLLRLFAKKARNELWPTVAGLRSLKKRSSDNAQYEARHIAPNEQSYEQNRPTQMN